MKKLLLAAAIATISSGAIAADNTGFYGGIEAAYVRVDNAAQNTANRLVNGLGGSAAATADTGIALGKLFAGYQFNENFSLEVGANKTSSLNVNFSGVTRGSAAYTGSTSTDLWGLEGSLLLRPSVSTGFNGLYGKVGAHWDRMSEDVTASANGATATGNYWRSGSGFLAGVGYDISIDKNLTGRVAYTYYDSLAGSDAYANVGSVGLFYKF